MKKLLIGFAALLLSNCAISQTSPTTEKLSFSVPKQSHRNTNTRGLTAGSFRSKSMLRYAKLEDGILYDIDNVKLFLTAADSKNSDDFLDQMKESMLLENKYKFLKWTFDDIKELNNFSYLLGRCRYRDDSFIYITIIAVDKQRTRQMVAYVEFDEKHKRSGEKIVSDLLKSMKFK